MERIIFVLEGIANTGKSTVIAKVLETLLPYATGPALANERGRERVHGSPEVVKAILTINGKTVGLTSRGDSERLVKNGVEPLVDANCDIIVCATRTAGGSKHALEQIAANANPSYEIFPILKISDFMNRNQANQDSCDEIVRAILAAT
jgi:hypothetical protein